MSLGHLPRDTQLVSGGDPTLAPELAFLPTSAYGPPIKWT